LEPTAVLDGEASGSAPTSATAEPAPPEAGSDGTEADAPALSDCPELDEQLVTCGQISIKLKGRGSSCQLLPKVSDLTLPPRTVRFDCNPLVWGPNGYDYDATGHITLTGDTCQALQAGGAHLVTLSLACGPGMSKR
jgi:hypothetical protein